jgi:8-amino-7-oxononanoate synthase
MTGRKPFDEWLSAQAAARAARGLSRRLRPRPIEGAGLDLAGNDYLGLSRDSRVVAGAVEAARTWGTGATGSRLVTGTTQLHADLDRELADFCGSGSALVFASGYAANLGVLTALADANTLIVSDERNHASLIDACRLARAPVVVTPHVDVDAVARVLAASDCARALVVTDAVFSVDGDLAPIAELHRACRVHGAVLVVDEAHSLGVVGPGGRGAVAAAGLADSPDIVRTVTLSKALGAQGGAVLATPAVVDHLVDTARTFIFDTGLAPPSVGAALAALRVLAATPTLPGVVRGFAQRLGRGLGADVPAAAIVKVPVGDPTLAVAAAQRCAVAGVRVGCFRPPSVPDGGSALRIAARADLTDADIEKAVDVVGRALVDAA